VLQQPLRAAVAASVLVHGAAIVALGWGPSGPRPAATPHDLLEVVLVNARSTVAPSRPEVLAQANLDDGGSAKPDRRASSPPPVASAPPLPSEPPVLQQLPASREALLMRPTPHQLQELARQAAHAPRDVEAHPTWRRTEFVGARAAEYRFAAYVDNWRHKVERVGNLNYPAEARRQRLYGSLQLTVVLRADGEVDSVTLNRSSGHRVLDEAAMQVVRMAGPYDRFPEAIARDTDFISITRTWTFSREEAVSAR